MNHVVSDFLKSICAGSPEAVVRHPPVASVRPPASLLEQQRMEAIPFLPTLEASTPISISSIAPVGPGWTSVSIRNNRRRYSRQVDRRHRDKMRLEMEALVLEVQGLRRLNKQLREKVRILRCKPQQLTSSFAVVSPLSAEILGTMYIARIVGLVMFELAAHRRCLLWPKRQRKAIVYPDYDRIIGQVPTRQLLIALGEVHANWPSTKRRLLVLFSLKYKAIAISIFISTH